MVNTYTERVPSVRDGHKYEPAVRVFVETDSKTDPTFALDVYGEGTSPGFEAQVWRVWHLNTTAIVVTVFISIAGNN